MTLYHKTFFVLAILVLLFVPFKSHLKRGRTIQRQCCIKKAVQQQEESTAGDIEESDDEAGVGSPDKINTLRLFRPFIQRASLWTKSSFHSWQQTTSLNYPTYILIRTLRV